MAHVVIAPLHRIAETFQEIGTLATVMRRDDRIRIAIEQVGEMTVDVVRDSLGATPVFDAPYTPDIIKQK